MKQVYRFFIVLLLALFFSDKCYSQDEPNFKIPIVYTYPVDDYYNLPQVQENINYKILKKFFNIKVKGGLQ